MIHFMLSMYLSSWWWVHGCMDSLQRITTGVIRLVVCDIFIPLCPSKCRAYNSKGELKCGFFFCVCVLLLVCGLTCKYIFVGGQV